MKGEGPNIFSLRRGGGVGGGGPLPNSFTKIALISI